MVRFHWKQSYMGEMYFWEINRKEGNNAQRRTHSHSDCSQVYGNDGKHSTAKCLFCCTLTEEPFKRSQFSYTGFMDKSISKGSTSNQGTVPVNIITLTAEQNRYICIFIALNFKRSVHFCLQ